MSAQSDRTRLVGNMQALKYLLFGRKPWSRGYSSYKERFISNILKHRELLGLFLEQRSLPGGYGLRLDERVVEYPWLFSRLGKGSARILDAGSSLNHSYILKNLEHKTITVFSLVEEKVFDLDKVSYIYGDLRSSKLGKESFDEIVCISTLEHIGMDNTFIYTKDFNYKQSKTEDYKLALKEFKRLLRPGGGLFVTVPYGRYENHGWLQQFDNSMIEEILDTFGGTRDNIVYYKYSDNGWQISDSSECRECRYFDINKRTDYDPDYAAAARAVACIELVK